MNQHKILIANRGEIAIRIIHSARAKGIQTVGVFSEEDTQSLHVRRADEAHPLQENGVAAYLNIKRMLELAKRTQCTGIHPGYGFLSENPSFAEACEKEGLVFVGPRPELLRLFGDKVQARTLAHTLGIPTLPGSYHACSLAEAKAFFESLPPGSEMLLKAMMGGGGKGMGRVSALQDLEQVYKRCQAEALKAFGNGALYVEQFVPVARHIEVQIVGDGNQVVHLGERECSIQRKHQKLIEIAPCPGLVSALREKLTEAALSLAQAVSFDNVGTVEFLVEGGALDETANFYFLELNPRIQVEHTVTEEITHVDLVDLQLQLSFGRKLEEIGLRQKDFSISTDFAIQARINMEYWDDNGSLQAGVGKLTQFELPSGKGIRVDTAGYVGYQNHPAFDSLLAKLIVSTGSQDFALGLKRLYRLLQSCNIEGIPTNIPQLMAILEHPSIRRNTFHTQFVEQEKETLMAQGISILSESEKDQPGNWVSLEGKAVRAPMSGSIREVKVKVGERVKLGQELILLEAMKMESVVVSEQHGVVLQVNVNEGDIVPANHKLVFLEYDPDTLGETEGRTDQPLEYISPELEELQQRRRYLLDQSRPEAVAKRRKKGKQTARENIAQLVDPGSFQEYGSLIVAAQRSRRSEEDLRKQTPADGIITGIGSVNTALFGEERSKCMVLCYDYTVLAGTQGMLGHHKTDRVLEVARKADLPIILFAEGGGGRPGDTDFQGVGGLHLKTFASYARLNGRVPRIAIVSGYCFAGNAALAGCSDIIIATEDTSIGMGGPAMIEGGGLGSFHPREVGPVSIQAQNGVLDLVVKDEEAAIVAAKQYLGYFQGTKHQWKCEDQRILRQLIPENRRRVYDIRKVILALADTDSVMELRKDYAPGVITAMIRIEGKAMGLIANNPRFLGGALDAAGAGKLARFMQLCEVFRLPMLSLCDTPGFMVGPEAEKTGLVRHTSRLFTAGAQLTVPFFTVVLRKAYGLGSMAMAGGGMHEPFFTVSWPTGEFGGMGLEGAVKLGYRKELETIEDPAEREAAFQKMVAKAYEHGKALNTAAYLEIDEVIDPRETRTWISQGLFACAKQMDTPSKGRGFVDTF